MKKIMTLCIVHQHPRVLLGMKKRGLGAGRWNGFGGKLEKGEAIEDAAIRECREEAGIIVEKLDKLGVIDFIFSEGKESQEVHFFKIHEFKSEPTESEEMKPRWFEVSEIPFMQMWPDDRYWMPMFLKNNKFKGRFVFDENNKIMDYDIFSL